jgi:endo-1,4-beta-D-glucanase Y
MFNPDTGVAATPAQVVFTPYSNSASFTDPSYHLPNFYWLWARGAAAHSGAPTPTAAFWETFVSSSRDYFPLTSSPSSGLAPDCTVRHAPTTPALCTLTCAALYASRRLDVWRLTDWVPAELCIRCMAQYVSRMTTSLSPLLP